MTTIGKKAVGQRSNNRLTLVFKHMKSACPEAIRSYAKCVESKHTEDALKKGICEKEFSKLKECFRQSIRRGKR